MEGAWERCCGVGGGVQGFPGGVAGIFVEIDDCAVVEFWVVNPNRDEGSVRLMLDVACEVYNWLRQGLNVLFGIGSGATPELFDRDCAYVKACDDPKVAGSALQGFEKIRVFMEGSVDDRAVGKDDLEPLHIVTDEAVLRRVE